MNCHPLHNHLLRLSRKIAFCHAHRSEIKYSDMLSIQSVDVTRLMLFRFEKHFYHDAENLLISGISLTPLYDLVYFYYIGFMPYRQADVCGHRERQICSLIFLYALKLI